MPLQKHDPTKAMQEAGTMKMLIRSTSDAYMHSLPAFGRCSVGTADDFDDDDDDFPAAAATPPPALPMVMELFDELHATLQVDRFQLYSA